MAIRHCWACGMPRTAPNTSAHVFPDGPEEGSVTDARRRPHVLGRGTDGGRSQGVRNGGIIKNAANHIEHHLHFSRLLQIRKVGLSRSQSGAPDNEHNNASRWRYPDFALPAAHRSCFVLRSESLPLAIAGSDGDKRR